MTSATASLASLPCFKMASQHSGCDAQLQGLKSKKNMFKKLSDLINYIYITDRTKQHS